MANINIEKEHIHETNIWQCMGECPGLSPSTFEDCPYMIKKFYDHNYATSIVITVLGTFAILTNIPTIILLALSPKGFKSHLSLVKNLALADILTAASIVVIGVLQLYFGKMFDIPCGFALWMLLAFAVVVSMLHTLTMAVENYIALFKPFYYKKLFTSKHTRILIAVWWFTAILLVTCRLPLTLHNYFAANHSNLTDFCAFYYLDKPEIVHFDHYILFGITAFHFLLMVLIYIRICVYSITRFRGKSQKYSVKRRSFYKPHEKLMKMTLWIFVTFFICWGPMVSLSLGITVVYMTDPDTLENECSQMGLALRLAQIHVLILPALNCLCDPVIYAVHLPEVKAAYQLLLRKNNPQTSSNNKTPQEPCD